MFTPMLIHIPHASVFLPPAERAKLLCPSPEQELLFMTDRFCDELFFCRHERIVFPVSRLVCDPERFRDDAQEEMAAVGMGAVYTRCADGSPLRTPDPAAREAVLRCWYDPHHTRLTQAVRHRLDAFGGCRIIDAHSFFPERLPYEQSPEGKRPDFCIGTDSFHTPDELQDRAVRFLTERGYTVRVNFPFAGALVPMRWYGRDRAVQSVMVEVNRRLYLTPEGEKSAGFAQTRQTVAALLRELEADLCGGCVPR